MESPVSVLSYLNGLRPAIPMSVEKPTTEMSNGELRRLISQGAVLINGESVVHNELVDFPVFSLVYFPRSTRKKTTLV